MTGDRSSTAWGMTCDEGGHGEIHEAVHQAHGSITSMQRSIEKGAEYGREQDADEVRHSRGAL